MNDIMSMIIKLHLKWEITMDKVKKESVCFLCFLVASICYYIASLINLTNKNTTLAIIFLCLGSSSLCLSTTHLNKSY